jgi:hypothetical protein
MTHFAVGEQVVIRFWKHPGLKGIILESKENNVYKVKLEGGLILYFSDKGLEKERQSVVSSQ